MFRYKEIAFRPMEAKDIHYLREIHNDMSTLCQLTNPLMVNEVQQEKWFNSISSSSTSMRYVVLHENNIIGCVRLDHYDPINRNIQIGGDLHKDYRGKGLGTMMVAGIIDYCFRFMNCYRLYLSTLETNVVARRIYKKCGMKEEGRSHAAVLRDGKYVDYINMYILVSDWNNYEMENSAI